jgi:hypothetical protein
MLPAVYAAARSFPPLSRNPRSSGAICDTADRLCTRTGPLCLSRVGPVCGDRNRSASAHSLVRLRGKLASEEGQKEQETCGLVRRFFA